MNGSPLGNMLKYRKFGQPSCSVIILDSGYLTVTECGRALAKLGHRVRYLSPGEDFIKRLLSMLVEHKPDFLLTVNHIGFDEEGKLTGLLSELNIPIASWYVDSPRYVLKNRADNVSACCTVFCWDRCYLPQMAEMGFSEPVYLPLATDPDIFRPGGDTHAAQGGAHLCFVGDSMQYLIARWQKKVSPGRLARLEGAAIARQLASPRTFMSRILEELAVESDDEDLDLEAALVWKATGEYRLRVMRALLSLGLVIYGDAGWRTLLGDAGEIRQPVDYHRQLPQVFKAAAVNINATSLQMNSAVNQRVFDVAACGAFLLTDHTADLEHYFEPGVEAVCYGSPEEARSLASDYLRHESERNRISAAARKRVLAEHTYERRMSAMVANMRQRFN